MPPNPSRRQFLAASAAAALTPAACQTTPQPPPSQPPARLTRTQLPPPAPLRLPFSTVFKGLGKFQQMVAQAENENWRARPLPARTTAAARSLLGIPYVNFTLEIDDHIEAPSANFTGLDCWTYYEIALGFARMLRATPPPHQPIHLLHMIEIERYRDGRCDGSYLSRMHHLEEVFADNERRGIATNVTRQLGGVRITRTVREMTNGWRSYRYLRNNPSLRPQMETIERRVSALPVYHIPKDRVRSVESQLQDGDILAISSTYQGGYTSHVGLCLKQSGRARFMHATSQRDRGRQTIIDSPITDYLNASKARAGLIVCRPLEL